MPTNARAVARSVRVFRDQALSPGALSARLAAVARSTRDDVVARGEAPANWRTFVDGRQGASEDAVRPDGAILYRFNYLGLAAAFALAYCAGRSPVADGDFKAAWIVAVDGGLWRDALSAIPPGAQVMVTNPLPYARKIDVGHMHMSVPHNIIEDARRAVRQRYPMVKTERWLTTIPAAWGGGYVLKGRFHRGVRANARAALRSDTRAGAEMTYPTLVITQP